MSLIQSRAAVGQVNRRISMHADTVAVVPSVDTMVAKLRPEEPLHCVRPNVTRSTR
jgi:ornithine decarboxylase